MSDDDALLWSLAATFAVLSFFAIGGVNPLLPEMHRQAAEAQGWMSSERFADLFAITQAAPGPNIVIVTLVGWEVGRLPGAAVATLAMLGPTSILAYHVGRIWRRFRFARWRLAIQAGVVPITVGLVAAAGFVLARAADASITAAIVTVAAAITIYLTRIHPLIVLAAGAALGGLGAL